MPSYAGIPSAFRFCSFRVDGLRRYADAADGAAAEVYFLFIHTLRGDQLDNDKVDAELPNIIAKLNEHK